MACYFIDGKPMAGGVMEKRGHPRELYDHVSSVDGLVPPNLPIPNCDCGVPAHVFQSRHPETAARCFYCYSGYAVSNGLFFPMTW
jgi:hypothetical protein